MYNSIYNDSDLFLAILANCAEELQELEISELKALLQHLPVMDMDLVNFSLCYNFSH
jgi:hypothetical protein